MARTAASAYLPVSLRPKATGKRITPPDYLGPKECEIFNGIVASLPSDWFHDCNKHLLADYAGHVVIRSKLVEQMEAAASRGDLTTQRALYKDLQDGSKLMLQFLRSMRLTQKSTKTRET